MSVGFFSTCVCVYVFARSFVRPLPFINLSSLGDPSWNCYHPYGDVNDKEYLTCCWGKKYLLVSLVMIQVVFLYIVNWLYCSIALGNERKWDDWNFLTHTLCIGTWVFFCTFHSIKWPKTHIQNGEGKIRHTSCDDIYKTNKNKWSQNMQTILLGFRIIKEFLAISAVIFEKKINSNSDKIEKNRKILSGLTN